MFSSNLSVAQAPDSIYVNNIKTVRLYNAGNQLTMPVINLNSNDQVELHFDDLDADVKYYYYTYQLCNSDWTPANLGQFDYIKGFTQSQNYQLPFFIYCAHTDIHITRLYCPIEVSYPTRSGNYIIKSLFGWRYFQIGFYKKIDGGG